MRPTKCPTQAEFSASNLGHLAEAALDRVAEHLEWCEDWERKARPLDARIDPLL